MSEDVAATISSHVDTCADCAAAVDSLVGQSDSLMSPLRTRWDGSPQADATVGAEPAAPPEGSLGEQIRRRIGRFLGSG